MLYINISKYKSTPNAKRKILELNPKHFCETPKRNNRATIETIETSEHWNYQNYRSTFFTCFGTSRLFCIFISAPVGVRDRVKVVRRRCMVAAVVACSCWLKLLVKVDLAGLLLFDLVVVELERADVVAAAAAAVAAAAAAAAEVDGVAESIGVVVEHEATDC